MTPKIALIIGIAATALAFGVPTGLAERQLVGLAEPDGVAYVYANERATLAQQSDSRARHSDSSATAAFYANERATLQATAPDWFERFVAVAAQVAVVRPWLRNHPGVDELGVWIGHRLGPDGSRLRNRDSAGAGSRNGHETDQPDRRRRTRPLRSGSPGVTAAPTRGGRYAACDVSFRSAPALGANLGP